MQRKTKAVRYGHQQIDVEHLLVALLEQAECQYDLNRAAELRYTRRLADSKGAVRDGQTVVVDYDPASGVLTFTPRQTLDVRRRRKQ